MKRKISPSPEPETSAWSVTVIPPVAGDARWRSRLLDATRGELERRLPLAPEAASFSWGNPLLQVRAERRSGAWRPGCPVQLIYQESLPGRQGPTAAGASFLRQELPDERLAQRAARLVGLDGVAAELLVRLGCAWDRRLIAWSEQTGTRLSPSLVAPLEERCPLIVLAGDPGVGKSVLVQAVADRYCRERTTRGTLLSLTTAVRGNGLVGDFGNQVRAAFAAALDLTARGPCFLLIDEADALAMRRSESHAHQEDRAGTATLLQCLDAVRGDQRLAVFLTTNLLTTLDAAVRRRAATYEIGRPDSSTRRQLLERWLPAATARTLTQAAQAARGMTPADMEGALARACLEAVGAEQALTPARVIAHLKRHERTGGV
jgi:hypothetical protein